MRQSMLPEGYAAPQRVFRSNYAYILSQAKTGGFFYKRFTDSA